MSASSADVGEFRIYCICGQKMRVSAAMFGRPGRCVACGQKMRVPRPEELPQGVLDVYLKDFPQFIRKAARRLEDAGAADEAEDAALEDAGDRVETAPLDTLEVTRRLCSYEFHVARALENCRDAAPGSAEATEKTTLMGYRALARKARAELDDNMRKRLMDVAVDLSEVKDRLARCTLSARVGEMEFQEFVETVTPLRRRRESLERLRQNLRGWLIVNDPFLAGGLLDVPLDDPPVDVESVEFPEWIPSEEEALLDQLLRAFRETLEEREYAERKLAEWHKVEQEGGLTGFNIERYKTMAEAARVRALAAAAFFQERVQQALQDAESEVKAVRAHLELARHRLETGEITVTQFNSLELELLRAQADSAKSCDLARQTLEAKRIEDVPRVQTKLFRRIARRDAASGVGVDSWPAWAGAVALVLSIFVPIVDPISGGNAVALRGLLLGLVLAAVLVALAASIPRRRVRGTGIGLVWLVGVVAFALYIYQKYHGLERVGAIMRRDPYWLVEPGMLLIFGGALLIAVSFCIALFQEKRMWHIPIMIGFAAVLIVGVAATDLAGYLKPLPVVMDITQMLQEPGAPGAPAQYRVHVGIANKGQRTCWLNPSDTGRPDPVAFRVARHVSGRDWDYDLRPVRLKTGGADWRDLRGVSGETALHPGDEATFEFLLIPGDYRVELLADWRSDGISRVFTLAPPPEPAEPAHETPSPEREPSVPEETAPEPAAPPPVAEEEPAPAAHIAASGPELELRGVGGDPAGGPRFVLMLHHVDGPSHDLRIALGQPIYRGWTALEYDPERQTLTVGLQDEGGHTSEIKILHTGERVLLPTPEPATRP
ncbi:MAG: hypothetical protein KA184_01685 [Candidatus Hydrogenedentes bacterium]|nr:hypothetical protein [Candidatus Hydrogenedentota bacterium]